MTLRPLLPAILLLCALAPGSIAGTPTTHYAWSKPTVSADADTWGTQLNTDLDGLDGVVYGKCDLSGGPQSAGVAGCTFTGTPTFAVGTTTVAPFRFQAGTNLTAPAAGAAEWDGTHLFLTQTSGPTRQQVAYINDAITGSAAKWTTARSIAMSGDVVWSVSADGSASVTAAGTIQAGVVTSAKMAPGAAVANIGYTPANKAGDTFTGELITSASATGGAGFKLPPGVAPASPANGECWVTATAVQCQVGGVTSTLGSSGGTGLLSTNNLSDVASVSTSRTNLGLTSAATTTIGTSGATIPLLSTANSWTTTQTLATGTTAIAPLKFVAGTNLTSPAAGAVEWNGTNLFVTQTSGPTRKTLAFTDSALSGNTTGSAATLTTGQTIGMTGDVVWTSAAFNGSGAVTGTSAIQAGVVTNADLANVATATVKGRTAAGTGAPTDLTPAQARVVVLPTMTVSGGQTLVVNSGGTDAKWGGYPIFASGYVTVSGTTPTLVANNNLSSISRTGAGQYVVTFATAAPDVNYSFNVTGGASTGFPAGCSEDATYTRTTTTAGIQCFNGGGNHDPVSINIAVAAN